MAETGVWAPLTPRELKALFRAAPFRWWVAGGWAIDLFVGSRTRHHRNIDVGVLHEDASAVREHLVDMDLHTVSESGELLPWQPGGSPPPDAPRAWCRRSQGDPWLLQLLITQRDGADWLLPGRPSVRVPADQALDTTADGIPYLRPYLQLLCTASSARPEDHADLEAALPRLGESHRQWLRDAVANVRPDHPWLARM